MKKQQPAQPYENPVLDWNEVAIKAAAFAQKFSGIQGETEKVKGVQNDQRFWAEFFRLFNLDIRIFGRFQHAAPRASNATGMGEADFLWRGKLLVEHKHSNLDSETELKKAQKQAFEYYDGLQILDKKSKTTMPYAPQYIIQCNFKRFRIFDMTKGSSKATMKEIMLHELPSRIREFEFFYDFIPKLYSDELAVNNAAAESLGSLHNILKEWKYTGKKLEILLTRLLFCCFAEDSCMFNAFQFQHLVQSKDIADAEFCDILERLFIVLNTPQKDRKNMEVLTGLSEKVRLMLTNFPYVNGNLFDEKLSRLPHHASANIRHTIEMCCILDWFLISPDIFGSLFQSVMMGDDRRTKGAHYTSETNILRALNPLFLTEIHDEIAQISRLPAFDAATIKIKNKRNLALHSRICKLNFLDPACGCGNFLVVAYVQLRRIETTIFSNLFPNKEGADKQSELLALPRVSIHQFHGIEYDEAAAHIAPLALVLAEQQCNLYLEDQVRLFTQPLPLEKMPPIRQANALQTDWAIKTAVYDYIIGNPPFVGKQLQNAEQKKDMERVFSTTKTNTGVLDYVTAWYLLAAQYMQTHPTTQTVFVSTNSVAQGEQVGVLWKVLFEKYKIKINFAHQTFKWHNEASGVAAVHCVIIGFANFNKNIKTIFEYADIAKDATAKTVKNINPYLVAGNDIYVEARKKPIADVPNIVFGNMPNDGGFLLLEPEEKKEIDKHDKIAAQYIRPFLGAHEFLNGKLKYCLWLQNMQPTDLKKSAVLRKKIEGVQQHRAASNRPSTNKLADTPYLFGEIRQPDTDYLLVPRVSSENRKYIPIGFFKNDNIAGDTCLIIPNADLYLFGMLTSRIHNAWTAYVCGRLKSDFRYSNTIVYNNFPFPEGVSAAQKAKVADLAQAVLDIRATYQKGAATLEGEMGFGEGYTTASLADLYHALSMPADLLKAHLALDKAVEACYRKAAFVSDTERVEYLFERYEVLGAATSVGAIKK